MVSCVTFLYYVCCSLFIISWVHGETRYFIETSTESNIARPRPLDICHLDSKGHFTIYSCDTSNPDPTQHVLTAESHGADYASCNSPNPTIHHFSNNHTSNDIIEGSFNCIGDDNYAIIYRFANEQLCTNYITSNKEDESNDNINEVQIIYRATNVCYHHNIDNIASTEVLLMNYCNAFYVSYRFFEDGSDCMNDLKTTLPDTSTSVGRVYSPNICSTDQYNANHSSIIMHQCVVNGVVMSPDDYDYDSASLTQITIDERIGLIDWAVSTGDMNNRTSYPWAEYFCHFLGLGGWNLFQIAENGNIYQSDGKTPICGIVLRDPGDIYTDTLYGFLDIIDGVLPFDYDDPFIRYNVNPLNKTIVYGLDFNFENIAFAGSIPNTICNLNNLHYLTINAAHGMYGTIPDCIGLDLDVHRLQLINLGNITGTIPESLCNVQNYDIFWIINLHNLTGTIPECFGDEDMNYRSLALWRNQKLTGTLPDNMFCGYHLFYISFHNNTNMSKQMIPPCWNNTRPFLMFVTMPNANLYGTMPTMPQVDYIPFAWLELQGNQLEGSVTDIFGDMQNGALPDLFEAMGFNLKYLQVFMIHDNLFHDDDITGFLQQIFSDNTNGITVFSMSNNTHITGTLPDINVTIKDAGLDREWTALLLHNLDLYGTIPQQMTLGDIDYLTLHNNRLSGYIPSDFKDKPNNPNITTSAVVLLGNLLWTDWTMKPPEWVDSKLVTAVNVFYTPLQQAESIFVVGFGFFGIVIGILYCLKAEWFEKRWFHHKMELFENKLPVILFFDTMQTLRQLVVRENIIYFWTILILTIFYSLTANYYSMLPYESRFALPYYWIDPNGDSGSSMVYMADSFLIAFALFFNWILFRLVSDLNTVNKQTAKEMQANKKGLRSHLKLKIQSQIEIADDTPVAENDLDEERTQLFDHPQGQLQAGWRMGFTNDGRLYYINDITKETQWSKPEPLPDGWEIRYTGDGRAFYQNHKSKRTQWERPEILPPLAAAWEETYTVDGRVYYQNHFTKVTQWERPTADGSHEIVSENKANDDDDDDDDDGIALEIVPKSKIVSVVQMTLYFVMWMLSMIAVIAYILSSSLPDDNIFGLSNYLITALSKIMPLLLVFNDKFVIPGFASGMSGTFCDGVTGKYGLILILQLINEIILPFVGSLILLNDCGRAWVNIWTLCVDDELRSKHFDIVLQNVDLSYTTLLTSNDVCGDMSIGDVSFATINYNKCLRSFLYNWTGVMMSKIVIGVVVEYCAFLWKKTQVWWHKKQQAKNKTDPQKPKDITIYMDGQYMSITMSLLVSMAFSFSAPMIVPINILEIMIKSILFKRMRYEYEWKFDIKHAADDQTMPVRFLWIGVGFNQLFTLLFCIFCLESGVVFQVLAAVGLFLMDAYIIRSTCKGEKDIFLRDKCGKKNTTDAEPTLSRAITVYEFDDYWKCDVCTMINENKTTHCKMCNNAHERNEEEMLPPGWSAGYTDEYKKYYKNEVTKQTQWEKPTQAAVVADVHEIEMEEKRNAVDGWSVMYTKDGRKYYQNNRTKQTSWNEPQSDGYMEGQNDSDAGSEKHEENVIDDDGKAQSVMDKGKPLDEIQAGMAEGIESDNEVMEEWTVMYTKDGRKYYQNEVTKETSWNGHINDNKREGVDVGQSKDVSLSELPTGWEVMYTNDGRKYYQNEITKITSWEIPSKQDNENETELSLPEGWSKLCTDKGKTYYQNDETKVTQWEHPLETNLGWMKRETKDAKTYYQNDITKETQWERPNGFTD